MTMNNQGRPTAPGTVDDNELPTISGDRGLDHEESLIFELGRAGMTGVDLPEVQIARHAPRRPAPQGRRSDLPGLTEPEVVRHYVRLSQHELRHRCGALSARLLHDEAQSAPQREDGAAAGLRAICIRCSRNRRCRARSKLIAELMHWLTTLTGMPAVAMSPKAGAHGELCGLLAIRAALEARGEKRTRVLVPESAHGTNPATAALRRLHGRRNARARDDGHVDADALEAKLGPDVAAIMLTNPNTCGLFERDIIEIADAVHEAGAYFYCDGANFNAIAGRVRPGDLGVDAMHINLHKTFSTPHGGGGPGAGPVVLSAALAPFAPLPLLVHDGKRLPPDRGSRRRCRTAPSRSAACAPSTARWACSCAR